MKIIESLKVAYNKFKAIYFIKNEYIWNDTDLFVALFIGIAIGILIGLFIGAEAFTQPLQMHWQPVVG